MNTLEFHHWGSRVEDIEIPERLVFAIGPDEGLDFKAVRAAALHFRQVLGEWGLDSYPMVSGGKGIHVIVPIKPLEAWPEIKLFCKTFAERLATNAPELYTDNLTKAARHGRARGRSGRLGRGRNPQVRQSRLAGASRCPRNCHCPWPGYFHHTQTVTKGMLEAVAGPPRKV